MSQFSIDWDRDEYDWLALCKAIATVTRLIVKQTVDLRGGCPEPGKVQEIGPTHVTKTRHHLYAYVVDVQS